MFAATQLLLMPSATPIVVVTEKVWLKVQVEPTGALHESNGMSKRAPSMVEVTMRRSRY